MPVEELRRLGQTISKRHARRAVSRNLVRRLAREAFAQHQDRLPLGDWFVRLTAPFARSQFPAAASPALRQAVRVELDRLFAGVGT